MFFLKSHRPSSLLGLALQGRQLEGVVLRRSNGTLKVVQTFRTSLSLDPLANDSELVGREIRNHLDEAGIRERHCAVCVPLQWTLTLQAKVPELPEQDVPSFLQIEAERGFPYAPDDLSIAISRYRAPHGEQYASLVAIPKSHLTLLEKVLRAARLKPLSFSLGVAALQEVDEESAAGLLTLAVEESCIDLQVSSWGGVVALRALENVIETEGAERHIDADLVIREIRITLGQLPKELRETVRRIKVFGRADLTRPLIEGMTPLAEEMGLRVQLGTLSQVEGYEAQGSDQANAVVAVGLAARRLAGRPTVFEFLPPRVSAWNLAAAKFSSRRLLYAGASAAAAVLLIGGAFLWQQWRLSNLEAQWRTIQPRVDNVEMLQQQARKFRPWFDESVRSLRIIRRLTEAFPEDGAVSVKTLEIKKLDEVSCRGQARDNPALLKLLDQLHDAAQIANLKVQQVQSQGKSPLLFNLSFRWIEGAGYEN